MTMVRIIIAGALISALLAAVQLAFGLPENLYPYGSPGAGVPTGLFANPNHQAQLMLAGLVASGSLIRLGAPPAHAHRHRGSRRFKLSWLLLPIFMVGTVVTQSRAGIILMIPAALAAILVATGRRWLARTFVLTFAVLAILAVAVLAVAVALIPGGPARFLELQLDLSAGGRITNFPDVLFTLQQFWPWGSGFGTFVPVFKANENLDVMTNLYLNHAHNDLLELMIEGGLPAAVLLFAGLLAIAVRLWRLMAPARSTEPAAALTGFTIIALALIHSLVDYPLRMHSLAAVAAVALALFVSPAQRSEGRP